MEAFYKGQMSGKWFQTNKQTKKQLKSFKKKY